MKKMLKGLTFAALIALSMLASTSDAFAKDAKYGRETAWTEPAPYVGLALAATPLGQGHVGSDSPGEEPREFFHGRDQLGITWE